LGETVRGKGANPITVNFFNDDVSKGQRAAKARFF
jgi:hypothetical protein